MDLETCSWCCQEVEDRTLRVSPDGARVCRDCREDEPDMIFSRE